MNKILCISLALLVFAFGVASAQDEDVLHVDATQDLGPISPYVFGANMPNTLSADYMPAAQALGLKYVRLGSDRSDSVDLDRLAIDLLVIQARQLGAEPALTVRLLNGTPEKAAENVRYANIEKGYNVHFWSIGNEPAFFTSGVHKNDAPPTYTTEDLNQQWRAIAEAMLGVDPTIAFVGPDLSQYAILNYEPGNMQYLSPSNGGAALDKNGRDWMAEFLRANGDLLSVVSVHRYPYGFRRGTTITVPTIDDLRANSREWDTYIPNLRKLIHDVAGRDLPIAVTEFNSNQNNSIGGEAGLDSPYNAIWLADVLGRFIHQQVNIALLWNLAGKNSAFGLFGNNEIRPTYYSYIMYTHFGTQLVESDWTDPDVSIYASRREDGTLTLMVVNLGPDEKTKTLSLDGFIAKGNAEVWRLDAHHNAEQIDSVDVMAGITVPGQSVTLYAIPSA